jgi:hypothetical protein
MRNVLSGVMLAVFAIPASASDADTVCASLYTYLADGARLNGSSNGEFEAAAIRAEQDHMARNPTDDPGSYSLYVIDGAATIRAGLAEGTLTNSSVQLTAARCNNHYFPGDGQQLSFPDDWWADQR